jgi:hypothetical protein
LVSRPQPVSLGDLFGRVVHTTGAKPGERPQGSRFLDGNADQAKRTSVDADDVYRPPGLVRAEGHDLIDLLLEGLAGADELVEHLLLGVIDYPHRDRV